MILATLPPARLRVVDDRRVAAAVEQDVSLPVPEQKAGNGNVDRLGAVGVGKIDAPLQSETAAGQDVHLHGA